tara:strand:+ start:280 stop:720 length:441 start_codon:yes stop_codon:yes gene_type:complete
MGNVRIAVVGGGIAGATAAYHLSEVHPDVEVLLLEAERVLAHHTTGRSAAIFVENLATAPNRIMLRAGRDFLWDPPEGLVDHPILTHRTVMHVATEAQVGTLRENLCRRPGRHDAVRVADPGGGGSALPADPLRTPGSCSARAGMC